jgi:hypothetical protein
MFGRSIKRSGHFFCAANIPFLRSLIPAAQQDHDLEAAYRIISAVAFPNMNAQFAHPITDGIMITEQARFHANDPGRNGFARDAISQSVQPRIKFIAGFDLIGQMSCITDRSGMSTITDSGVGTIAIFGCGA